MSWFQEFRSCKGFFDGLGFRVHGLTFLERREGPLLLIFVSASAPRGQIFEKRGDVSNHKDTFTPS